MVESSSEERLSAKTLRRRVYEYVEPSAWPPGGLSPFNKCVIAVIVLATLFAIVETEPLITNRFGRELSIAETLIVSLFIAEYLLRFWVSAEQQRDGGGWKSRLKFIVIPASIVDLVVIATSLLPFFGPSTFLLRAVRLVRIIRLASLGGFSLALATLLEAVSSRRYELLLSLGLALGLMLLGATAMWLVEAEVQPDQFGSIPRALWWALVTLTTIGYGDAFPVTPIGKLLAALVAVAGIGLIALPSGILAAAFSDIAQQKRNRGSD